MTIDNDRMTQILRLHFSEHWRVGTIARQLGVHHDTVRRVLAHNGVPEAARTERPSKLDPYLDFIQTTLTQYPARMVPEHEWCQGQSKWLGRGCDRTKRAGA